jgi:hypothetical protein
MLKGWPLKIIPHEKRSVSLISPKNTTDKQIMGEFGINNEKRKKKKEAKKKKIKKRKLSNPQEKKNY